MHPSRTKIQATTTSVTSLLVLSSENQTRFLIAVRKNLRNAGRPKGSRSTRTQTSAWNLTTISRMVETEPYKVPYGLGVGQILFGGTSNISIVRGIVQHFEELVHSKSSSTDQVCNCKRSVTFASMLAERLHQIARN